MLESFHSCDQVEDELMQIQRTVRGPVGGGPGLLRPTPLAYPSPSRVTVLGWARTQALSPPGRPFASGEQPPPGATASCGGMLLKGLTHKGPRSPPLLQPGANSEVQSTCEPLWDPTAALLLPRPCSRFFPVPRPLSPPPRLLSEPPRNPVQRNHLRVCVQWPPQRPPAPALLRAPLKPSLGSTVKPSPPPTWLSASSQWLVSARSPLGALCLFPQWKWKQGCPWKAQRCEAHEGNVVIT